MPRNTDKRERLIGAADRLILRQGFKQTTLSDIASDAGVPLGNVYYYFKTKREIGETIVRTRIDTTRQWLDECSREADPRERLLKFLEFPACNREALAESGCALGTLSYELRHSGSPLDEMSRPLMDVMLEWTERQFADMGRSDASDLALQFVASLQGMCLIANALTSPEIIDRLVEHNRRWLQSL